MLDDERETERDQAAEDVVGDSQPVPGEQVVCGLCRRHTTRFPAFSFTFGDMMTRLKWNNANGERNVEDRKLFLVLVNNIYFSIPFPIVFHYTGRENREFLKYFFT